MITYKLIDERQEIIEEGIWPIKDVYAEDLQYLHLPSGCELLIVENGKLRATVKEPENQENKISHSI